MRTHRSYTFSFKVFLGLTLFVGLLLSLPRFFIFEKLCQRGLECAKLYREPNAPFKANTFSKRSKICGDLSTMAHRPDLCQSRPEIFKTDSWGYRNSKQIQQATSQVIIYGDSFAFGQGVSQEDTPAMQIQNKLKQNTYNAAGKFELNYLRWILEHKKERPLKLIYFYLERHFHKPNDLKQWNESFRNTFHETWSQYNPLKILLTNFDKKYLTPKFFPNRFEENVPIYNLRNNQPMTFLKESVESYGATKQDIVPGITDYFTGLQKILKSKNVELTIVLLPEKYTVYAPLLKSPPKPIHQGPHYLNLLEQEMKRQNLSVINMLPIYLLEAERYFEKSKYLYWPDDTHWNELGISIMIEKL